MGDDGGDRMSAIPKTGIDDLLLRGGPCALASALATEMPVPTRSDELYKAWICGLCHEPIPDALLPAVAEEILRKGLFDVLPADLRRDGLRSVRDLKPALAEEIMLQLRRRLDREFAGVGEIENGGRNITHSCWVQAPAPHDGEPFKVVALDSDVVFCAVDGANASRPFLKRHVVRIERPNTSADNGQGGGRPPSSSPAEAADAYLARICHGYGDTVPLRCYRGDWFRFNGRYFARLADGDVRSALSKFFRNHPSYKDRLSVKFINDVMAVLMASDACGVESTATSPCWIDSGRIEPADGWTPMANCLLNIPNLARMLAGETVAEEDIRRELTPRLFCIWGLPYAFDPNASCPRFDAAIAQILPAEDVRVQLQMMAGLCLIPETKFNVFFVLLGPPGTAKSTVTDIFVALIGSTNTCYIPFSRFCEKHSVGDLTEKLVNVLGDSDTDAVDGVSSARMEGLLKNITDGGIIRVEKKFKNPYDARATARIVQAANDLPHIYDRTGAVWDRLRVIPFEVPFRGTATENPDLRREIVAAELPGILLWAIAGLAQLLPQPRFPESSRGRELKAAHTAKCDHEREFLLDTCEICPDHEISTDTLYRMYRSWASANGQRAFGSSKFKAQVKRIFPCATEIRSRDADGKNSRKWRGIRFQEGVQ